MVGDTSAVAAALRCDGLMVECEVCEVKGVKSGLGGECMTHGQPTDQTTKVQVLSTRFENCRVRLA